MRDIIIKDMGHAERVINQLARRSQKFISHTMSPTILNGFASPVIENQIIMRNMCPTGKLTHLCLFFSDENAKKEDLNFEIKVENKLSQALSAEARSGKLEVVKPNFELQLGTRLIVTYKDKLELNEVWTMALIEIDKTLYNFEQQAIEQFEAAMEKKNAKIS